MRNKNKKAQMISEAFQYFIYNNVYCMVRGGARMVRGAARMVRGGASTHHYYNDL